MRVRQAADLAPRFGVNNGGYMIKDNRRGEFKSNPGHAASSHDSNDHSMTTSEEGNGGGDEIGECSVYIFGECRFRGSSMAGPKFDQSDLGPNTGAHGSKVDDVPFFPARGRFEIPDAIRRIEVLATQGQRSVMSPAL